jgi:hypothetical protein
MIAMINGIHILATHIYTTAGVKKVPWLTIIILIIGAVIAIVSGGTEDRSMRSIFKESKKRGFGVVAGLIIMIASIIPLFINIHDGDETHKEYKVTLDNSVRYNEFVSKYKVIKVEGKILNIERRKHHELHN